MRDVYEIQLSFGCSAIQDIKTDPNSRDEIDKVVLGLQKIITDKNTKDKIIKLLKENISPKLSKNTGRPGMSLWNILVLGIFRQTCNWDYDKLHNMANNHIMLRKLLGHDLYYLDDTNHYALQTIKDNVKLLTPKLIDQISDIVVNAGHTFLGEKKTKELQTSGDSFVVKTNIHYPTDITLLFDSIRKSIDLTFNLCKQYNVKGMRQSNNNKNKLKSNLRKVQQVKHSSKSGIDDKVKEAHIEFISKVRLFMTKITEALSEIIKSGSANTMIVKELLEIGKYMKHAERQINQIERRVLDGEKIPHHEKIFSIFEEYTRWISKGKQGVPVEFGLPVAIIKDQFGYILCYEIMEETNDVDVAVPLAEKAITKYRSINTLSFDKGFWSRYNREKIGQLVATPIMPKKGRCNKAEKEEESSKKFKKLRNKHSAVESSINGLNHNGLEKCYDKGKSGFKRCVALSILARNLQTLGNQIQLKEEKQRRRKTHVKAA
jgi:hypothetical protein